MHQVNGFCLNAAHLSPASKVAPPPWPRSHLEQSSMVFEALGFTGALKMPKKSQTTSFKAVSPLDVVYVATFFACNTIKHAPFLHSFLRFRSFGHKRRMSSLKLHPSGLTQKGGKNTARVPFEPSIYQPFYPKYILTYFNIISHGK